MSSPGRLEAIIARHGSARTKPFNILAGEPVLWMCHGCGEVESPPQSAEQERSKDDWFASHLAQVLTRAGATLPEPLEVPVRTALIDGPYRYKLTRVWGPGERMVFIMLNPSTADADIDDPTIRRCIGFAKDLGFDGLEVVNLFALRSPDPAVLAKAEDPVGPLNDRFITDSARGGMIVAAWGAHPFAAARGAEVAAMVAEAGETLYSLGVTKDGHPRHPLYLPGTARPEPWAPSE